MEVAQNRRADPAQADRSRRLYLLILPASGQNEDFLMDAASSYLP
jgi:hypothetical protein